MAQLIQCDFCGNITNQIAAQIIISLNSNIAGWDVEEFKQNSRRDPMRDGYVKDCCFNCVKKFIEPKPVPLSITPSGEAVQKEDL